MYAITYVKMLKVISRTGRYNGLDSAIHDWTFIDFYICIKKVTYRHVLGASS